MTGPSWRADKRSAAERGYGAAWQRARLAYLQEHPLCSSCERYGQIRAATVVDHIRPHKGDAALFWDVRNWQPLCATCHNGSKQAQEKSGRVKPRIGLDGYVVEPEGTGGGGSPI